MSSYYKERLKTIIPGCLLFFSLTACHHKSPGISFSKDRWSQRVDPAFPPAGRTEVLGDLLRSYKLTGLTNHELVSLLGKPDVADSNSVSYMLEERFGSDIDPVYSRRLTFFYTTDSVVSSFKVEEWSK